MTDQASAWASILAAKDAKTEDILKEWEAIQAILADGKVQPSELPALTLALSRMLVQLAGLLQVLVVDPKIGLAIRAVAVALAAMNVRLADAQPALTKSWGEVEHLAEDGRIDIFELRPLLAAAADIIGTGISIVFPFVPKDVTNTGKVIQQKIERFIHLGKSRD